MVDAAWSGKSVRSRRYREKGMLMYGGKIKVKEENMAQQTHNSEGVTSLLLK